MILVEEIRTGIALVTQTMEIIPIMINFSETKGGQLLILHLLYKVEDHPLIFFSVHHDISVGEDFLPALLFPLWSPG